MTERELLAAYGLDPDDLSRPAHHAEPQVHIGPSGSAMMLATEYSGTADSPISAQRPALRLYSEVAGRLHSGVQTE